MKEIIPLIQTASTVSLNLYRLQVLSFFPFLFLHSCIFSSVVVSRQGTSLLTMSLLEDLKGLPSGLQRRRYALPRTKRIIPRHLQISTGNFLTFLSVSLDPLTVFLLIYGIYKLLSVSSGRWLLYIFTFLWILSLLFYLYRDAIN